MKAFCKRTVGPAIRSRGAEAIGGLRKFEAIQIFLNFLRDEDSRTRGVANTALMVTTGKSMGFRTKGTVEQRETAIRKWEEWYQQHLEDTGASPAPPQPAPPPAAVEEEPPVQDEYAEEALREAQDYATQHAPENADTTPGEAPAADMTPDTATNVDWAAVATDHDLRLRNRCDGVIWRDKMIHGYLQC